MFSGRSALSLFSVAVMLPYFADASAFPDIARQTGSQFDQHVKRLFALSGSTMNASRLDRRSLAEDAPLVCALYHGSATCALTSTEAACDAESSYSCDWDPDNGCELSTTHYLTEYDLKTDSSYQKLNSTTFSCYAYDEDAASCNAVSSCTHGDDGCSVSLLGISEILDAYCPSQDLTSAQYVAQYDMCPYYTKAAKCAQYTSRLTCIADSDCDYDQDPTDPWSSKYPCGPKDMSVVTDLAMAHAVDILLVSGTCSKYESSSACNADMRCDWEGGGCGVSDAALASIFQNHPHLERDFEVSETCSDVSKAQCGVGNTADKCEWLVAFQGENTELYYDNCEDFCESGSLDRTQCDAYDVCAWDDDQCWSNVRDSSCTVGVMENSAECLPTFAFWVRQLSCECDGIFSVAPSIEADVTCKAPVVQFVDTGLASTPTSDAKSLKVYASSLATVCISLMLAY